MELLDIGTIIVALLSALGAWAAQRSASRSSIIQTQASGRLDAERDAYGRARNFDVDTIAHQQREINELRIDNQNLRQEMERIIARVLYLEKEVIPNLEKKLNGHK